MNKANISDDAFVAILNWFMETDPWPQHLVREPIEDLLDDEARSRGFSDWIEALHQFRPPPMNPPCISQRSEEQP